MQNQMLRQPAAEEYRGDLGGLAIGHERKKMDCYTQRIEEYKKELIDQIQEKKLKDN